MFKDYIPRFGALAALALITGCGTANVVGSMLQQPVSPSPLQPVSVLDNLSLDSGRDVIVRLKSSQDPLSVAKLQKQRADRFYAIGRSGLQ